MRIRAAVCVVLVCSTPAMAQELIESSDYSNSLPGPSVEQVYGGCFLLASGRIDPGDVDWVGVLIPFDSDRTVIDVDFPSGVGQSFMLVAEDGGATYFGMADSNGPADDLCGLGGASFTQGSPSDSVVDMFDTVADTLVHVGVTGGGDFGFSGNHAHSFDYEVWVYAGEPPSGCVDDLDCDDGVDCTVDVCDVATGECSNSPDDAACDNGMFCDGAEVCDAVDGCLEGDPPCDDHSTCDEDAGSCLAAANGLVLDIRPGACPNWVSTRSRGVLQVALMGTEDFEVGSVDTSTLMLWRADGAGDGVAPWTGWGWNRGRHIRMIDVGSATPAEEACDCVEGHPDGMYDMLLKFRVNALVNAMYLDEMERGSTVELTLTGLTRDGVPFAASDCVSVVQLRDRRRAR